MTAHAYDILFEYHYRHHANVYFAGAKSVCLDFSFYYRLGASLIIKDYDLRSLFKVSCYLLLFRVCCISNLLQWCQWCLAKQAKHSQDHRKDFYFTQNLQPKYFYNIFLTNQIVLVVNHRA